MKSQRSDYLIPNPDGSFFGDGPSPLMESDAVERDIAAAREGMWRPLVELDAWPRDGRPARLPVE